MKPKYSEIVNALAELRQWVDASVLNACSSKEIRDSYSELCRASMRAAKLVKRARQSNP
jgi:hypothetical protein